MGSRSIASIPARPAPSARRACSLPAPPSWAYPRKRRSGRTLLGTRREAMPSAAWWTLRRSRSSRSSWPRKRPGRSPASWSQQAVGPGGRYITEQRYACVSIDFFQVESGPALGVICNLFWSLAADGLAGANIQYTECPYSGPCTVATNRACLIVLRSALFLSPVREKLENGRTTAYLRICGEPMREIARAGGKHDPDTRRDDCRMSAFQCRTAAATRH